MEIELCKNITVNGWNFELVNNNINDRFYQCRGEVMYDDDHDEMPEPKLWQAALKLEKKLKDKGIKAEVQYSEKGWVEVCLLD